MRLRNSLKRFEASDTGFFAGKLVDWVSSRKFQGRNEARMLLPKIPSKAPASQDRLEQLPKRCGRSGLAGSPHGSVKTVLRGHKSA